MGGIPRNKTTVFYRLCACVYEREREKALVIHIYNCFKINKKLEELSLIIVYSMNNALKDLKTLGQ